MKKFIGDYKKFQTMTHDELIELISSMSEEEKDDLENNYIAQRGMNFLGVKNYIARTYFPQIFKPEREKKPSFEERLEAVLIK
ncbi:MAG: hypothetical protein IKR04_00410 [Clostridia bacterium]|nr:hypothetical protein [Clostridia bacterium]